MYYYEVFLKQNIHLILECLNRNGSKNGKIIICNVLLIVMSI